MIFFDKKIFNYLKSRIRKNILEEIWLEDYIKLGMKIGTNCSIQPGVTFDYSHCWLIHIGNNVTIAPQAYILAHDASSKPYTDYTKVGTVIIEDNVFIGARTIIMPNVTVGENSIIAAGSVVTKSIPSNCVAGGNPAKVISTIEKYKEKLIISKNSSTLFETDYTIKGNISYDKKEAMFDQIKNSIGFVR